MPDGRALQGGGALSGGGDTGLPQLPDVWALVDLSVLPKPLTTAFDSRDWNRVRVELSTIMDTAITDGAYGRALLQLVLALPEGIDAVLDRYRASAMLDH